MSFILQIQTVVKVKHCLNLVQSIRQQLPARPACSVRGKLDTCAAGAV